jgi:hypothetical protein
LTVWPVWGVTLSGPTSNLSRFTAKPRNLRIPTRHGNRVVQFPPLDLSEEASDVRHDLLRELNSLVAVKLDVVLASTLPPCFIGKPDVTLELMNRPFHFGRGLVTHGVGGSGNSFCFLMMAALDPI